MSHPADSRDEVEQNFADSVLKLRAASTPVSLGGQDLPGAIRAGSALTGERCLELFDAQLASRHLDLAARWLRQRKAGFYTIGSSGHEGNAAVAAALRGDDPALLHYRSGAFYLVRAACASPPRDGVRDVLLGLVAAAAEPISGGRHKVIGHADLHIIPQTSTIASHLPRAVGLAFALDRAARLSAASRWPADAIVVASLGDASVNHSTAVGALNTAGYCAYQRLPLPLLIVCEDNGLGISVRTPPGWVEAATSGRPGITYFRADGSDLADVYDTALAAAALARHRRTPVFLHLSMVRLGGHAGADAETGYRDRDEVAADLAADPLVGTARLLVEAGLLTPAEVLDRYERSRARVLERAQEVAGAPRLATAEQVMAPLAPRNPDAVWADAILAAADQDKRHAAFGGRLPEAAGPLTLAQTINATLTDAMVARPEMLVFGQDVARKGGVYGVTRGLLSRFGASRVFDTLLDEQAILGLALGAGLAGLLPVPEIQYLAYLHNAADQIRGEAATLPFFSQGQYRNPMVLRIAGYAYQEGFGGHFHNDNAVAALRDITGLIIASPARPEDAAAMLRTCLAAAAADGSVCVFLEPIALYHTRDLYKSEDGAWRAPYEPPEGWAPGHAPVGRARTHGSGTDLTIMTFGNG
ncbi:MAG TPA: thiamine pyrophosphate-dependent enzyme, partial [Streptosporangiaceae bacterium]